VKRVHVLMSGLPLCGFTSEPPGKWPDGDKWVAWGQRSEVTCTDCYSKIEREQPFEFPAAADEVDHLRAKLSETSRRLEVANESVKRFSRYYALLNQMFPYVDVLRRGGAEKTDDEVIDFYGEEIERLQQTARDSDAARELIAGVVKTYPQRDLERALEKLPAAQVRSDSISVVIGRLERQKQALEEKSARQAARLAAFEAALRRHARHENFCGTMKHPSQGAPFDCTCGLDEVLLTLLPRPDNEISVDASITAEQAKAASDVDFAASLSEELYVPPRVPLFCPFCGAQHIDEGEWATTPHHKHLCALCKKTFRIEPYMFGAAKDPELPPKDVGR
jgi:hypothetical protein